MKIPNNLSPTEREQIAIENFKKGYNCCQSLLLTFSDIIELSPEIILTISSGFGGGMGRLREVCGSFSGMVAMAGFISPATDPTIKEARTKNYALVQEFAEKFKTENGGSIICKELLNLKKDNKTESPQPSDRTKEYYQKRPCAKIVGTSAKIITEKIIEMSQI
ncbi:MAG: C-GCAxxG-C-C family protein [Bacteroidales bacterium]|nr:C-GCAxxG-C-C family protein [Bacteroidales bacterium]